MPTVSTLEELVRQVEQDTEAMLAQPLFPNNTAKIECDPYLGGKVYHRTTPDIDEIIRQYMEQHGA